MKLILSSVMIIILLRTLLTACKGGTKPDSEAPSSQTQSTEKTDGSVEVDLCVVLHLGKNGNKLVTALLKEYVPGYEEDFKVNIELVLDDGADRETALTHIRIEMLEGKCPELFVCACYGAGDPGSRHRNSHQPVSLPQSHDEAEYVPAPGRVHTKRAAYGTNNINVT